MIYRKLLDFQLPDFQLHNKFHDSQEKKLTVSMFRFQLAREYIQKLLNQGQRERENRSIVEFNRQQPQFVLPDFHRLLLHRVEYVTKGKQWWKNRFTDHSWGK